MKRLKKFFKSWAHLSLLIFFWAPGTVESQPISRINGDIITTFNSDRMTMENILYEGETYWVRWHFNFLNLNWVYVEHGPGTPPAGPPPPDITGVDWSAGAVSYSDFIFADTVITLCDVPFDDDTFWAQWRINPSTLNWDFVNAGQDAPLPIEYISARVDGQSVEVRWNTTPEVAGYYLHYGSTPSASDGKVDMGMATSISADNVSPGTYYLGVSTYNPCGLESLVLFTVSAAVSDAPGGPLTSNQADEKVHTELVPLELVGSPTKIYRHPGTLGIGDTVQSALMESPDGNTVFIALAATYFYFVDYLFHAFYAHPVEYIFMRADIGDVTRVATQWWPMVNDTDVFYTTEQASENILAILNPPLESLGLDNLNWDDLVPTPEMRLTPSTSKDAQPSAPVLTSPLFQTEGQGPGDAIIINGVRQDDKLRGSSEKGTKQAKDSLTEAGYEIKKEFDTASGDEDKTIIDWLKAYDAPSGRNLTIFILAHGNDTRVKIGRTSLTGSELKKELKRLKEKEIRVKLIIEACYSGNLLKAVKKYIEVGVSSSSGGTPSADDVDGPLQRENDPKIQDPDLNPDDEGPEFSSGYWEDYAEIKKRLKDSEQLRRWLQKLSERTGVPQEELILYASYVTGVEKDITAFHLWRSQDGNTYVTKPQRYPPDPKNLSNTPNDPSAQELKKNDLEPPQDSRNMRGVPDWIEKLIGRQEIPESELSCAGFSGDYAMVSIEPLPVEIMQLELISLDPIDNQILSFSVAEDNTIQIFGSPPFVNVQGEISPQNCYFIATGSGPLGELPDVSVAMEAHFFSVLPEEIPYGDGGTDGIDIFRELSTIQGGYVNIVVGEYSMGVEGELPGGEPIVFYFYGQML